jgi:hypothetical protein
MRTDLLVVISVGLASLPGCPSRVDDDTGDDDVADDDSASADDDAGDDDTGDDDTGEPTDPMALAELVVVCDGEDPDVAVDAEGHLHVVYERDGETWYREVVYPDDTGSEIHVGDGDDPQVVVDGNGMPHVVMGALSYGRWNGSGFTAQQLTDAWRKPRLAVDGQNRIFATVSRDPSPRVILFELFGGAVTAGPIEVGEDNNGAIDCDSADGLHLTWRDYAVYHAPYDPATGAGEATQLHGSSDFSWIAVDTRDDSLHVVNTVRYGEGIHYRTATGGVWGAEQVIGYDEVIGVDDPDNVGPTIDVDRLGNKYVAFAGRDRIPYFFMVDVAGGVSSVERLDPDFGSLSGGKYENPNVGAHPDREGACVAWGDGQVMVRCVGVRTTREYAVIAVTPDQPAR